MTVGPGAGGEDLLGDTVVLTERIGSHQQVHHCHTCPWVVLICLASQQDLTRQPWICYSIGIMSMQVASRNSGVVPMTATNAEPDPGRGVYAISVAAELVGMGSQTLRLYERRGLIEPARSAGGTRRYSSDDLDRLRRIARLVAGGLNLAGISMVLDLEDANAGLRADVDANRQLWSPVQSGRG